MLIDDVTHKLLAVINSLTRFFIQKRSSCCRYCCIHNLFHCHCEGGDLARRSVLLTTDSPLTHIYDDATTLYEFFLRGTRVSSKSPVIQFNPNVVLLLYKSSSHSDSSLTALVQ